MKKTTDKVSEKGGSGQKSYSLLSILFFMSGICGMLMAVGSVEGVEFEHGLVFAAAGVTVMALWLCYRFARRLLPWLMDAVTIAAGYFLLSDLPTAVEELQSIGYNASNYHEIALQHASDVTWTLLLLTILICVFLFSFEFVLQIHVVSFVMVSSLLIAAPLLGVRLSLLNILLIAVFQYSFMAMHITGRGLGRSLVEERRMKLSGRIGLIAAVLTAVAFLIAIPIVNRYDEQLYDIVFTAEGNVAGLLRDISRRIRRSVSDGFVNRGNNYKTGRQILRLDLNKLPEDALYIKSFSGSLYDGREWAAADEAAFNERMSELMGWSDSSVNVNRSDGLPISVEDLYFMMNVSYGDSYYELMARHLEDSGAGPYRPYFSTKLEAGAEADEKYAIWEERDASPEPSSSEGSAGLSGGMDMPDTGIAEAAASVMGAEGTVESAASAGGIEGPSSPVDMQSIYDKVDQAGLTAAQELFTSTGTAPLLKLHELVEENPLESLDEITAFIIYTLHSSCEYTTTPGQAPVNADIAEYFLFESHRGYCQQFASAATLMYKLYGVPARYVSGFRIQPEKFKKITVGGEIADEEGGTAAAAGTGGDSSVSWYTLDVTDIYAHAWTEIYISGYGWTPIEVTPGEDGAVVTSYPGVTPEKLLSLMREHGWPLPDAEAAEALRQQEEAARLAAEAETETQPPETVPHSEENQSLDNQNGTQAAEDQNQESTPASGDAAERHEDTDNVEDNEAEKNTSIKKVLHAIIRILLILTIAAAVFFGIAYGIMLYRKRKVAWLQVMNMSECGRQYMELLHFNGLMKGFEGIEPGFAKAFEEELRGYASKDMNEDGDADSASLHIYEPDRGMRSAAAADTSEGSRPYSEDALARHPEVSMSYEEIAVLLTEAAFGPQQPGRDSVEIHADTEGLTYEEQKKKASAMRKTYFDTLGLLYKDAGILRKAWMWIFFGAE